MFAANATGRTRPVMSAVSTERVNEGHHRFYLTYGKRIFDIVSALVLLILGAPIMLLIGGVIALDGHAPIFAHQRVGRLGKPFKCLKFRSMVPDAQARLDAVLKDDPIAAEEWRTHHKLSNDPRVTRLGHFLRKSSLDELPQLINVLRGDMSMVGPRPVTAEETAYFSESLGEVLSVRPGITGLWQVNCRGNSGDYSDRVILETSYARSVAFFSDFVIFLKTFRVMLARTGV